jgi:hypothetical protein
MGKFWLLHFSAFFLVATLWAKGNSSDYGQGIILTDSDLNREIYFFQAKDKKNEVLLHFKNIGGGELQGKSKVYLYDDQGNGRAEVYFMQKKGSKNNRFVILSKRDQFWNFQDPSDYQRQFSLSTYVPEKIKKELSINSDDVFKKID